MLKCKVPTAPRFLPQHTSKMARLFGLVAAVLAVTSSPFRAARSAPTAPRRRVRVLRATTEVNYALNSELARETSPKALLALVEERCGDFNDVNIATALRRLATARLRREERARGAGLVASRLEASLEAGGDAWDGRSLCSACWAFAKLELGVPGALAAAIAKRAGRMEPRELATTAWALATAPRAAKGAVREREGYAGATPGEVDRALRAAAVASQRSAARFSGRDASTVAFAVATARLRQPECLAAMARRLAGGDVAGAGAWNGQDVANAAWALASARQAAPRLYGAVARFAAANATRLSPQGAATCAWAFATQRKRLGASAAPRPQDDAKALEALAVRCAACADDLDARSLALVAWAFAAASSPASSSSSSSSVTRAAIPVAAEGGLFAALEARAIPRLARDLSARDAAALAWALATKRRASEASREAFRVLGAAAAARPEGEWSPQALATILWAFATQRSGANAAALFGALAPVAAAKAGALAPRDVATVLWAYAARARVSAATARPDALFRAVATLDGLETLARGSSAQSLANLAWAVATLYSDGDGGLDDVGATLGLGRLLDAVADAALPLARDAAFEAKQLATLCRSLAAVRRDAPQPRLLAALGDAAASEAPGALAPLDVAMVADALARCRHFVPNARAVVIALGDAATDRADAFDAHHRDDLCRALVAAGAVDHPFFAATAARVFARPDPDSKLLMPPTTAYVANDTTRVQVLEVVPYDAMFLPPARGDLGDAPPRQDADVASL